MQHAPSRHISRMISVFQKIDFFLQLAGYILDERVGGDLGIMAYHLGEVPCETRRLFGRARDVNRGDIRRGRLHAGPGTCSRGASPLWCWMRST